MHTGLRIATRSRAAAADGELPEPRDGHRLVARGRVGEEGVHGGGAPALDIDAASATRAPSCNLFMCVSSLPALSR